MEEDTDYVALDASCRKPAARLICSISPVVNNSRAHPSARSQMSLSDRLYDVVRFLASPPVMRVFPRVACLHVAAYHQGPLRETQPTSPPPCLLPAIPLAEGSIFPSAILRLSLVSGHQASPHPIPLTAQGLGNRLCLMCWQFHLTLLSLISLASSLLLGGQ